MDFLKRSGENEERVFFVSSVFLFESWLELSSRVDSWLSFCCRLLRLRFCSEEVRSVVRCYGSGRSDQHGAR
jgi:hypothetical protein